MIVFLIVAGLAALPLLAVAWWAERPIPRATVPEWCLTGRPSGARGARHPLPVLP